MKTNSQAPERAHFEPSGALDVHSVFYTIQGEGPFAGSPAVFVRLSGCNLQCPACDTCYTKPKRFLTSVRKLMALIKDEHTVHLLSHEKPLIVITGGEPLRQNVDPFVQAAHDADYIVQIETNGTLPYIPGRDGDFPIIVCSPKTGKVNESLVRLVTAWKYVVEAGYVNERGLPLRALQGSSAVWQDFPEGSVVYVQPMDEQEDALNREHMKAAVTSCLKHGYKLCLQMHKIAGLD